MYVFQLRFVARTVFFIFPPTSFFPCKFLQYSQCRPFKCREMTVPQQHRRRNISGRRHVAVIFLVTIFVLCVFKKLSLGPCNTHTRNIHIHYLQINTFPVYGKEFAIFVNAFHNRWQWPNNKLVTRSSTSDICAWIYWMLSHSFHHRFIQYSRFISTLMVCFQIKSQKVIGI